MLFRSAVEPPAGSYYADLAVQSIRPNPKQPRQVFDEDALAELLAQGVEARGAAVLVGQQQRFVG